MSPLPFPAPLVQRPHAPACRARRAKGTPFSEICQLTDAMEGSIVRAMVRLDETCREFRDAARVMGDTALFRQMEAASVAIKRDIIFAASLYVA